MKINIQIKGLRDLASKLRVDILRLNNIPSFWGNVGEYLTRRTIKECFDKERTPDGEKWQGLSPSRVKQRMKRHKTGNMKILQDTGELRRSIRYKAFSNGVIIGSNLKYSKIHQYGGTIEVHRYGQYKRDYKGHKYKRRNNSYSYVRKIKIPARKYLGVTQADKERIISMLRMYVTRQILQGE